MNTYWPMWLGAAANTFNIILFKNHFDSISMSLVEAAKLDGITTFKRVWYIDLPLLVGQIKYFFVVGLVNGVQNFDYQLIITDGGPNNSTTVPGYMLYMKTYGYSKLGEASAIGVVLVIITFALTVISNRITKRAQEEMV